MCFIVFEYLEIVFFNVSVTCDSIGVTFGKI